MLQRQKRLLICVGLFIGVVLVFTRVDYLIHSDLYANGLIYDDGWFWTSQIIYFLMYQFAIVMFFLYSRSLRLLMVFEAFVCTGGMDIVGFFGIWNAGHFPPQSTIWTWNLLYHLFGFQWTTLFNIWLTAVATGTAIVLAIAYNPDKNYKLTLP